MGRQVATGLRHEKGGHPCVGKGRGTRSDKELGGILPMEADDPGWGTAYGGSRVDRCARHRNATQFLMDNQHLRSEVTRHVDGTKGGRPSPKIRWVDVAVLE